MTTAIHNLKRMRAKAILACNLELASSISEAIRALYDSNTITLN
jgi:hypothetical protein